MSAEKNMILIAGPCVAESFEMLEKTLKPLLETARQLGVDFYFKSSFDKANRSSARSYRGPGWPQAKEWFVELKKRYGCKILTDIHETHQVDAVAQVCDGLQIPAFLCRQTDLILTAARTGRFINIKKGQFMAPHAMGKAVEKALEGKKVAVTERGTSFGYGDLIVDMRSFSILKKSSQADVIFDITHSVQKPAVFDQVSSGERSFAPLLARCAMATGCCDGIFLEVHPEPETALSDASLQIPILKAQKLIHDLHGLWLQQKAFLNMEF